ncbi:DUF885 domain-containing protein [Paraurantiacibacter namhicola]|uniref:Lipoprotein n=1 Tax=Paraurantiacibacter namhicola TaxID=645517 RepID=A0A1C7DB84_9SPHN|nr:DUF885 domain-containing protein [Paraurantiacibacter namhicola]ANU08749.1 hypothetical protein A6F65_02468 [Paraurantiacibacter namhicola]
MRTMFLATTMALAACAPLADTGRPIAATPADKDCQPAGETADAQFEALGCTYVDLLARYNPVYATSLGDHRFDGELPDISADGRAEARAAFDVLRRRMTAIDFAQLSRQNQVDYRLLENSLAYSAFSEDELQAWAWNPQYYHSIASSSIYTLVARDFAPWPERFDSIVQRMEKLPAFLAAARQQIDVSRVPKVHAETVAKQNAGISMLVETVLLPEVVATGVSRTRFDDAVAGLKVALAEHQAWLDDVVVPGAEGEFRLGPDRYATKMAFALQTDMSVAELQGRARAAYTEARGQMEVIARTFPECDVPGQQEAIQCALAISYADRPERGNLEEAARGTLAEATAFTEKEGFVRMPDGPVEIITMPVFQQGNSVAYLDAPGPLERSLPAFYAMSPVPDDWTEEQATSFLSEYNISMLHLLSIHEGVPGHYLQLDHANRFPGTLRAVLSSGPFIEGWAVYSERVMAEHDYLGGMETREGRLFILNGLKFRLRAIANTLLDIGIHTQGMTRAEAMDLMMVGAFQQEREAAGKWVRANLSSVQLLSYFTGYAEHVALRQEAEQRWGADFNERTYHDAVLSHGSPPVKYARALIFDLPVE